MNSQRKAAIFQLTVHAKDSLFQRNDIAMKICDHLESDKGNLEGGIKLQ